MAISHPDNVSTLRPRAAGPRTAFVCGGGGNLGASQVGMLRALLDRGIRPDVVVGCSVGALNGAVVAADPTPAGVDDPRIERAAIHAARAKPRHTWICARLVVLRALGDPA